MNHNYSVLPYRITMLQQAFRTCSSFQSCAKLTQLGWYIQNGTDPDLLSLIEQPNKRFGSVMEEIARDIFDLQPRISTQHDHSFENVRIEQKSARYHAGKLEYNWQHLEPEYDYSYVLFAGVTFQGIQWWGISKDLLMGELREKKIVQKQGQQGWTCVKSKILPYLTEIQSKEHFHEILRAHSTHN